VGAVTPLSTTIHSKARMAADVSVSGTGKSLVMEVVTSGDEKYKSCELGGLSAIGAGVSAAVEN